VQRASTVDRSTRVKLIRLKFGVKFLQSAPEKRVIFSHKFSSRPCHFLVVSGMKSSIVRGVIISDAVPNKKLYDRREWPQSSRLRWQVWYGRGDPGGKREREKRGGNEWSRLSGTSSSVLRIPVVEAGRHPSLNWSIVTSYQKFDTPFYRRWSPPRATSYTRPLSFFRISNVPGESLVYLETK